MDYRAGRQMLRSLMDDGRVRTEVEARLIDRHDERTAEKATATRIGRRASHTHSEQQRKPHEIDGCASHTRTARSYAVYALTKRMSNYTFFKSAMPG